MTITTEELARIRSAAAGRASIKDCIKYDSVENCIKKGFPCIKCFREKARKVVGEGEESCPKGRCYRARRVEIPMQLFL